VESHHFWADDISIRTAFQPGALIMHNQITDVYLLALAAAKRGKLATLDQRIVTIAVENGGEALELIIP
jgi:hypothetical protein